MKNKELLLSQQFQNLIEKSKKEAKSITLTHIYMGVHLTWLGAYTSITSFGVSQDYPLGEIIKKKHSISKVYNSIENKTNLIINTYC